MSETNIIVEKNTSGVDCKIVCPECGIRRTLSSSVYGATGTFSFTVSNFADHYRKKHGQNSNDQDEPAQAPTKHPKPIPIHTQDDSLTKWDELQQQIETQNAMIAEYMEKIKFFENERDQKTEDPKTCMDCNVFKIMLDEKEAILLKYKKELNDMGTNCVHCEGYKQQINDLSASLATFKEQGKNTRSQFFSRFNFSSNYLKYSYVVDFNQFC